MSLMTLPRRSIWPAPSRRSIWPGRYGTGSGVAIDPLTTSEFYSPLTHSLILTRGTGSATYTRATTAWEFDNEGKLVTVPSGIPRFGGARFNGTDTWYNTDSGGSPISAASLLGYHSEGARTNSLLYSRDLTKSMWLGTTVGSELVVNGTFDADTDWTKNAATIGAGVATFDGTTVLANGATILESSANATFVVGKRYTVTYTLSGMSGANNYVSINCGGVAGAAVKDSGTYIAVFTAVSASIKVQVVARISAGLVRVGSIDNISVKEAAIQVTTCTGIDNAANSASTLTAGAANATILQTLTLASAARSSSAYVKRRTGTGTISFTRDGGTTWTDITSLINSSTWTRVKIENTSVTNPSIGFLIATSGDAIDVDVVQDEAGAFSSSPIVTTTAAVTRNADVLSYATASNWSDTAGAARASVQYDVWANASGVAIGGTNGLVLSTSNSGVQAKDGTNTVNGPTGTPSGTELLAMGWGSGTLNAASGGTLGTAGSYDGAFGLSTIAIGAPAGYIKETHIWQSALTDAQLQTVTT